MPNILDVAAWKEALVRAFDEFGAGLQAFLPQVVTALLVLGVGWLAARLLEMLTRLVLAAFGLDRRPSRLRLSETLSRAGVTSPPSRTFGRLLFWVVMMAVGAASLRALDVAPITSTVDRLVGYVPMLFAAGLIILLGLLLGRLTRRLVASMAAAANLPQARSLGAAAGAVLTLFVFVLALEQLGVDTAFLLTIAGALVAGVFLTMGTALALGARPVVTHILAGHFLRQSLLRGATVEVHGRRGTLERVGPVETILRDRERSWSVPNAVLLEETIGR